MALAYVNRHGVTLLQGFLQTLLGPASLTERAHAVIAALDGTVHPFKWNFNI